MRDPYIEIANKMNNLSKSQKKVAQYVLDNPNKILFQTVEKLAKEVGVSDSTVVRFSNAIGYKGYPDLQDQIQNRMTQMLKTTERIKKNQTIGDTLEEQTIHYISQDLQNVQGILDNLDLSQLEKIVDSLLSAGKIYIISSRSADAIGIFFNYYLDLLLGNVTHVKVLETDGEKMLNISQTDVVFAISTARYTRSTVELFKYAKEKNACTIALTDNLSSPLVTYADLALYTKCDFPSFFDSFTAPLSLINLLLALIARKKEGENTERLEEIEALWSELNIFY
ncbi:MurR/RpiR family transcriptional regulator [Ureibacillus sp. NPDC094379]